MHGHLAAEKVKSSYVSLFMAIAKHNIHSWVESREYLVDPCGGDGQHEEDDDGGVLSIAPPPRIVQLHEGHSESDGEDEVEGAQDTCGTVRLNFT